MQYDQKKAQAWLKGVSAALPNFAEIIHAAKSNLLVIGAGVFDLYASQGWTPSLRRKTGDLDLSVGLLTGADNYESLKKALLSFKYAVSDARMPYRFYSPNKIPGGLTYIDLLAHPVGQGISDEFAKKVMGVGSHFSLKGFQFADMESFNIEDKLTFPNPLAMVGLKRAAYLDDPERIKDLADIAELGWGIVERGTHFEMQALWEKIKGHPDAAEVRKVLVELACDSVVWDLNSARQELLKRTFSGSDIDELIPSRLREWASYLL
ncbi:MAG: hypothetical protein C5B49_00435 [Bdellovibrio sp.]|nr:MAG: hypothetical protein C5B49_00435 [Bdellovibrio sp.]